MDNIVGTRDFYYYKPKKKCTTYIIIVNNEELLVRFANKHWAKVVANQLKKKFPSADIEVKQYEKDE